MSFERKISIMEEQSIFDNISPIDYRYRDEENAWYLSENASTEYKLMMEEALINAFHRRTFCSGEVVKEIQAACDEIRTAEVYEEEDRIHHDIRALVNCIRAKVSDSAKPYVHMTATSYDIIDSANAARYKDAVENVLIVSLLDLEKVLIEITLREADTLQIGRTHGQHAIPITFGFAMAGFVSRLGNCIQTLKRLAAELPGKFSGAVGAYNALFLFFNDPERFEESVLDELGLKPAEHSTQIVPPEALIRLFCEVTLTVGVLANLADDMRNLQRTEIAEVGEEFEANQVGSSTMAHKRNPINFENVKSSWKVIMPRIITLFMDQISEHQRDLTNSMSGRTYGEMIAYAVLTTKRLTRTMKKLVVDNDSLQRNFAMQARLIVAEPLYLILAVLGHPDAYEKVCTLIVKARAEDQTLENIITYDAEMREYLEKMTPHQRMILAHPDYYVGIAAKKAQQIATRWKKEFAI